MDKKSSKESRENFSEKKYMFKVNNKNNRKRFEICSNVNNTQSTFTCSKLTIKTLEQDVKYVHS